MRTTLALDDDVARLLKNEVRRSGESFQAVVNRALRTGLTASSQPAGKPFKVNPRALGLPEGLDCVAELIEALEGPLIEPV